MRIRALLATLLLSPALLAQEPRPPEPATEPAPGRLLEWLSEWMPAWLRNRAFLLENWQWIGLVVLALLGIILGAVVRYVTTALATHIARARGTELDWDKRRARPFGLLAQGLCWTLLLPLLALPDAWYEKLHLAAQVVAMLGILWSLCRVIDWFSAVFTGLASRTKTGLDDLIVPMLRKALKVVVVALGIVWIADNLGMNIAALLAGLSIGGVAVALASKDTVENLFGAASILTDRPFQVGDWIRLGNIEGTVEEVGFRTTRVRTFYNSLITFPNAILIRSSVDNLGARRYRRIKQTIGVTYDTPADKLEAFIEGIRELIRRHPYTRKDYFHVYFTGFSDSALDILLYVFVETPDWATELREKHRLMLDILRLAQRLGVEFAFPTRTLHMIESQPPEPGTEEPVSEAHRHGRREAREIVEEFTGSSTPPPVRIAGRPDDALDDDGEG